MVMSGVTCDEVSSKAIQFDRGQNVAGKRGAPENPAERKDNRKQSELLRPARRGLLRRKSVELAADHLEQGIKVEGLG